jgi:hypothetical protein
VNGVILAGLHLNGDGGKTVVIVVRIELQQCEQVRVSLNLVDRA